MKLLALLPLAFSLAAQAIPVAHPAPNALASPSTGLEKRASIIKSIEKELKSLDLSLESTVDEVVAALGLTAVDDDVDALLKGLVGDVQSVVNEVDDEVDGLLDDLGLSEVVSTIDDLEKALGINPNSPITSLLNGLGISY